MKVALTKVTLTEVLAWFLYIYIMFNTIFLNFLTTRDYFTVTFVVESAILVLLTKTYYLIPLFFLMFFNSVNYYAYNLLFFLMAIVIFSKVIQDERLLRTLFSYKFLKFNRIVFPCTILIAFLQWGIKDIWRKIIPFQAIPPFRGSAFQIEPSFVARPLLVYILLQIVMQQYFQTTSGKAAGNRIAYETLVVAVMSVIATRSMSVLFVLPVCFALFRRMSLEEITLSLIAVPAAFLIAVIMFRDRLLEIFGQADSTNLLLSLSNGAGSWRNIPDIAIARNISNFLLPSNPQTLRYKINFFASQLGYNWLISTFNLFSAGVSAVGLLPMISILTIMLYLVLPRLSNYWINYPARFVSVLYIVFLCTFILPKGAVASWLYLGGMLSSKTINIIKSPPHRS